MVCIRCKKRPAIIFVQRMDSNSQMKQEGYCLRCARELHIKPVEDLMKQFGMSEQDMDNMEDRMENMLEEMGGEGANPFSMMMGMGQPGENEETDDAEGFTPGGNATFPLSLSGQEEKKDAGRAGNKKPPPPQVPGYLLREPDREGPGGQDRRHHRPGPGDLPHHPDFEPPPEE